MTGVVTDTAGAPLTGAVVTVQGSGVRAATGEAGTFRITGLTPGPHTIEARRLGFTPGSVEVVIAGTAGADASVRIRLAPIAVALTPVTVTTRRDYTGRLAGYYERLERRGAGIFITREQIDRENPRMLTHLLAHAPGVRATRLRGGRSGVRLRGRDCWPLVWLDGTPMPAGDVDLDAFPPQTLHGIELYLGSTTAPIRFIGTRDLSSCGTILLWSRGPDTDPVTRPPRPSRDLEQLLATLKVFTADQVDRPAQLDSDRSPVIGYPQPLYASGATGRVIAEFVADAAGRIEAGTFGVVSSSHPLFTEAVRSWSSTAIYAPAMRDGQPVRQLIHQPFEFDMNTKGSPNVASDSR